MGEEVLKNSAPGVRAGLEALMGSAPAISDRVADALVVVMTEGVSLGDWDRAGLVSREWAIWAQVGHRFGRMVVVSYDRTGGDVVIASRLSPRPEVIWNEQGASDEAHIAAIPHRVAALLGDAKAVVVRTNQYRGGRLGAMVTAALRGHGVGVGFVARGGYISSRWIAWEQGAESELARRVAEEEALVCARADMVIGPRTTVEDMAWRYGVAAQRTAIVPNWVVTDRPPVRVDGRDALEVLAVGRMVKQKRMDVLVEAMGMLPGLGVRDARLTIVGGGPEEDLIRGLAKARGVRAEFFGREAHERIVERMGRCGVFAQTAGYEGGSPKTVLEAMAAGAPVVAVNTYGQGNVIDATRTGVLTSDDSQSFAHGLARTLSDEGFRERIGGAASAWARREHGVSRIAELEMGAHRTALARGCAGAHRIEEERRAA